MEESFEDDMDFEDFSDESNEEDDIYEQREIGANPIFKRLQDRYANQLQRFADQVTGVIREKKAELKVATAERVELGVNLYNAQQQLAKMQVELKSKIDQLAEATAGNEESKAKAEAVQNELEEQKKVMRADEGRFTKAKTELDKLREEVQLMELLNEKVSVEVAVLRRRAYANEVGIKESEKGKAKQDFFIDDLTQAIASLRQKQSLFESRLGEQKLQTEEAEDRLKTARKDMEEIEFEKNQLNQEWKMALVGIRRRDLALQQTNEALDKQKEATAEVDAELQGFKINIRKAQKDNEQLAANEDKVDVATQFVDREVEKMIGEQDKANERYKLLKKSLDKTDNELKLVNLQKKGITSTVRDFEQNYRTVMAEKQKLEDFISQNASTQTTVSKAVTNMKKQQKQARSIVREKEATKVVLENEVAKLQVDALNTKAHNVSLNKTLGQCLSELKSQDTLIEKYELEIRQRHDDVEKKMYIVDRLNRKYEQLTANTEDENHGPLEATIKNMEKQLGKTKSENQEIQRDWLQSQTQLVSVLGNLDNLNTNIRNNTSKMTVLEQKRLRINDKIATAKREVKDLDRSLQHMHNDMDKLNSLISRNKELRDRLKFSSEFQEQEFVAELGELQQRSIVLQNKCQKLQEEKVQVDKDILHVQELMNLYEKKITQEQEMAQMLDPNVGQKEAHDMEKAIHRMKLQLSKLKREQEDTIIQIEMSIDKREALAHRFRGQKDNSNTNVKIKKKCTALRRTIKANHQDTMKHENEVKDAEAQLEKLEETANTMSSEQQEIEGMVAEMQEQINDMLYQKQKVVDSNAMMHRLIRKYKALNAPHPPPPASPRSTTKQLVQAEDEKSAVLRVVSKLQEEFPHLQDVLGRVGALTQIKIPI
jgi:chromosome segregation ATPase